MKICRLEMYTYPMVQYCYMVCRQSCFKYSWPIAENIGYERK